MTITSLSILIYFTTRVTERPGKITAIP